MKAVVKTDSGMDHMEYMDIPTPEATGDLVQIKIAYSGICGTDLHAFKGTYASTKPPVVLGHEFSGVVTAVGPEVRRVKVGDRVTSETTFQTCGACPMCKSKDYNLCGNRRGIGTQVNGSMAEYLVSREESVHVLPDNVSLLSAALTEPLACGVHATIEKGKVQPGDICVVFGAGAIGQMVGQVAKSQGATVIMAGLTHDAERFAIAKESGIDRCVDQMTEDLSSIVMELTGGVGADKCFECSGAVPAANKALEVVRRKGTVVQMGVFPEAKESIWTDLILHKEIVYVGSRSQKPSSWVKSLELLSAGTVVPEKIITSIDPLENWRDGFEKMIRGEGAKGVLVLDDTLK
ncbi:MAG: zinc-binding dehydrogenase [Butyricicoccus pullicaecorum]|jgi:L-iditol 2-dehydrogenase|nr:zinc-binding dehydrogenase [Butyricicoccus pullicaecorum]